MPDGEHLVFTARVAPEVDFLLYTEMPLAMCLGGWWSQGKGSFVFVYTHTFVTRVPLISQYVVKFIILV